MTRRDLLALLTLPGNGLFGQQGMATRGVKAAPRGKASGLPFHARLTDVAAPAGLTRPVVYGGIDHVTYILETMGAGVAFIDYDDDGWLDIFLLGGSRLEATPKESSNRLYHNNRDGTFTDVTERADFFLQGCPFAVTVGDYHNDGFYVLLITYWEQNVLYRNN